MWSKNDLVQDNISFGTSKVDIKILTQTYINYKKILENAFK